jgi:hypothetical protein
VLVEALVTQAAVEALDEAILHRLARGNVVPFDTVVLLPMSSRALWVSFMLTTRPFTVASLAGLCKFTRGIQIESLGHLLQLPSVPQFPSTYRLSFGLLMFRRCCT